MAKSPSSATFWLPEARAAVWLAALVLGTAVFLSEHNVRNSLATDFTESAEEMLVTAEGGNTLRRLAFLAIAGLGIGCYLAAPGTPRRMPSLAGWLMLAVVGLAFASVLWAQDAGQCVRRLLVLALALMGAAGLARQFTLKELCLIALAVSLGCVLIGVGCEMALGTFRPWTSDYRFSGTVHPNTQGMYLAVVCFSTLCLAMQDKPRRLLYWTILSAALVLLVLTKSRTSTAGTLATLVLMGWMFCSLRARLLLPVAGVWVAATGLLLLLFSGADADHLLSKVALLGREEETESFNGRTTIWPAVEFYIARRPWLGYGFESFWTTSVIDDVSAECEWGVREAHSSYREMLLHLGIVGLVLYCGAALAGLASSLLHYLTTRDAAALFWSALVLNGFFNGLFESGMVWVAFPTFIVAAGLFRLAYFQTLPVVASDRAWQPHGLLLPCGAH